MIRLLIDANLSWRLAAKIRDIFPGSIHVNRCGLPIPSPDAAIWEYARQNDFVIITQDEDFFNLASVWRFPPKVIFITRGNSTSTEIAALLHARLKEIISFCASSEKGLLQIL